ncbi:MAG TPA: hypothetical protein VNO32_34830, partial [Candidatus Acidoferrum sp.]|nr:hypothetical protein [Candidatus Acidoferrum sp.]
KPQPAVSIGRRLVPLVAVLIGTTFPAWIAFAQAPVTLQEQLSAQYKPAKMGSDSGGVAVVEPGTLLSVEKGGVLSVPWKALALCPAKFQENSLHASAGMCAAMVKSVSRYFQKGDRVYPTKIDVNVDKAKISFTVVACDSCNQVNPPTSMKGEVVFQFAKGYLEKASVGEVEDTIGQVFAISSGDQQGQSGDRGQQPQESQPQPAQSEPQQAETQTIQLGMTTDQVQSSLGKPEKIFNVGSKQIYVYKDVKVTFLNGKVSDVQ